MNHSLNSLSLSAKTLGVLAVFIGVTVFALFTPIYAADYSTAAELKLMEGFPPPPDKQVTKATALQTPPFNRWSYQHMRMSRMASKSRSRVPARQRPWPIS